MMPWRGSGTRAVQGAGVNSCVRGSVRALPVGLHLGPDLLAQKVNRHQLAVALEVPVGPAVAAWAPPS